MLLRSDLKNRTPLFELHSFIELSKLLHKYNNKKVTLFHYQYFDKKPDNPILIRTIGRFCITGIYFFISEGISNGNGNIWFTEQINHPIINIHTIDYWEMPDISNNSLT